jgi:hypothetical protein
MQIFRRRNRVFPALVRRRMDGNIGVNSISRRLLANSMSKVAGINDLPNLR